MTVASTIPLGILGDSDSHAYHDRLWMAPAERGGAYRAATFQWPEVLARVRGGQFDLGGWGTWGQRRVVVRLQEAVGLAGRMPRKEDYQYNLALGGARCADLMTGDFRQAPRLVALMDRAPERWRQGVVVIRIGVIDVGLDGSLQSLSRDPAAPDVVQAMAACTDQILAAVRLIHRHHPETRIVLVGLFNNVHWPKYAERWQSAVELERIATGLGRFDAPLRALAAADPRIAFFDDNAWFARHWGSRDAAGRPAYRTVEPAPGLRVIHGVGDHPSHAVVADGHAGTAWNTLWVQALVALMNEKFKWRVAPLGDDEVAQFLRDVTRVEPR